MKRIRAKFIGKDGSLGYIHGKFYSIIVTLPSHSSGIHIHRFNSLPMGDGECVYNNIIAFLDNWDAIENY